MQTPQSRAERAAKLQAEIETLRGKARKAVSVDVRLAYLELAAVLTSTLDRIEAKEDATG